MPPQPTGKDILEFFRLSQAGTLRSCLSYLRWKSVFEAHVSS